MRELRVVGLNSEGTSVICDDAAHAADSTMGSYSIMIDDSLRAAIRGDLTRLGQIQLEIDPALRPRDIQQRVRAGASPEDIAAASGVPLSKVMRFAHPVLLERQRAAEFGSQAHPVRGDGPMDATLAEVVTAALAERGHAVEPQWDAWKSAEGAWIVQVSWTLGRTRNAAHFTFSPGSHGGTAIPADEHACGFIDPDSARPLRRVTSIARRQEQPAPAVLDTPDADAAPEPAAEAQQVAETSPLPAHPPVGPRKEKASSTSKPGRPAMPSWEDVLLGVRTSGGS